MPLRYGAVADLPCIFVERKAKEMKKPFLFLWILALASAGLGEATVSQVIVRQDWPWSGKVNVDFVVRGIVPGEPKDVSLNLYSGEAFLGVAPEEALAGDTYGIDHDDAYRVSIDPKKVAALAGTKMLADFRVEPVLTASSAAEVLYKLVDIATGETTDVTEGAIRKGRYGTYAIDPVATNGVAIKSVVWTGVTNDVYKETKIAFRRIRAGSFRMGSPTVETGRDPGREKPPFPVRLTADYYIGVYPVTQRQLREITGSYRDNANFKVDRDHRPQEVISYNDLRGAAETYDPFKTDEVGGESFIGVAREKLKLKTLDLPTEAEWEYACRAGTTGAYNDGTVLGVASAKDDALDRLGRNKYDGGCHYDEVQGKWVDYNNTTATDVSKGTAAVGSYASNAWGLYDMHGNVREVVLDWYAADYGISAYLDEDGVAVNPKGPSSGTAHVWRGGGWNDEPKNCRSAARSYGSDSTRGQNTGMRLVIRPAMN